MAFFADFVFHLPLDSFGSIFFPVSTLPHFMNSPLTVIFPPTVAQKAVILKVGLELFYIITEPFL